MSHGRTSALMHKTNGCDRNTPFSVLFVGKSGIEMWAVLLVWSQGRKQEGERWREWARGGLTCFRNKLPRWWRVTVKVIVLLIHQQVRVPPLNSAVLISNACSLWGTHGCCTSSVTVPLLSLRGKPYYQPHLTDEELRLRQVSSL